MYLFREMDLRKLRGSIQIKLHERASWCWSQIYCGTKRLWSEKKAERFPLIRLRYSMWNLQEGAHRMLNHTRIRKPKAWKTSRGLLSPCPIVKIFRRLKRFFLIFLKKRKEEEKGGKRGEKREDPWNTGAQNERQPPLAFWKGKLFSRDFKTKNTDKLRGFLGLLRSSCYLYNKNMWFSLS